MPVYNPPTLQEMYNVTLNGFSTIAPLTIPTAGYVGASDGVGGIRFITQSGGGSVDSNYAFSNLRVADTLSTSSTFTDYLSAGQIYASSLIVQSAVVVGSNTLTVLGQSFLSSVTLTGQLLISTIPGESAAPLSAELISSLNVQTSTVNFVDTTDATVIKSLYVEAGSLKYDGFTLGTTTIGSNFGFSNLNIIDTLSTVSTFTNEISTGQLKVSTILFDDANQEYNLYSQGNQLFYNNAPLGGVSSNYAFSNLLVADTLSTTNIYMNGPAINQPGGLVSLSNATPAYRGNKVTYEPSTGTFYVGGLAPSGISTILYGQDGQNWLSLNAGGFDSNSMYTGAYYTVHEATALFALSTPTSNIVFAGGPFNDNPYIQSSSSNPLIQPVDFTGVASLSGLQQVLCFGQSNTDLPGRIYVGGVPAFEGFPLYFSDDLGTSWNAISTTQFASVKGIATDMTVTPSLTYAVGPTIENGEFTSTLQYTTDGGATWTSADLGFDVSEGGEDILSIGTTWYACGKSHNGSANNKVLTSADGVTWTGIGTGIDGADIPLNGVYGLASDGTHLVAVGETGDFTTSISSIGIYSFSGSTWESAHIGGFPIGDVGRSIAYSSSNGTWVAVGSTEVGGQTSTILYSTDRINWNSAPTGEFVGSNYRVTLNVDVASQALRSDKIVTNLLEVNNLQPLSIQATDPRFMFTWGQQIQGRLSDGLISTAKVEVSTINGAPYPRMYFSTLQTDPSEGGAQWDFPLAFGSVDSYSATLTTNVKPDGTPILVSVTERSPSYVQFSTFNVDLSKATDRTVYGIAIGS